MALKTQLNPQSVAEIPLLNTPDLEVGKKPKVNLKYMRDKDREMVKGMFRFFEVAGGVLSFTVRLYKEDQPETFHLKDGEVYEIPLGVAKHLNKNGWYPEYGYVAGDKDLIGGFGPNQTMKVTRKVRRYEFHSLEFVDIEDFAPDKLVSVQATGA